MSTWGDMAAERDKLIDCVLAFERFRKAKDHYENTAYKGDALRELNTARNAVDKTVEIARPIVDKYRR